MNTIHILIVDDESDMRQALSFSLTRQGYSVDQSSNAMDAIEKVRRLPFSLAIVDERMPNTSGIELMDMIKQTHPNLPVIIITAYGTIENSVKAMQLGASDYIQKPFSSGDIAFLVKKYAIQNRWMNVQGRAPLSGSKPMLTRNEKFMDAIRIANSVARSSATVLIQGESGTGKELLAAHIHSQSKREGSYIAVNCAALPETLAESELFGYEKGAFTGALKMKPGKFELADSGTIVLDEISELSFSLQAKLLRALQEKMIDRIGGCKSIPINFRLIAISNTDLKTAVMENTFREDLYYRLNVIPITIPPLRNRKEDVILLTDFFIEKYCLLYHFQPKKISEEVRQRLCENPWRGNVRELENIIERAVLMSQDYDVICPDHLIAEGLPFEGKNIKTNADYAISPLKNMEKEMIFKTLKEVNENRTQAAKRLGISIRTLRNKLNEYKDNAIDLKRASA